MTGGPLISFLFNLIADSLSLMLKMKESGVFEGVGHKKQMTILFSKNCSVDLERFETFTVLGVNKVQSREFGV